MHNAPAKLMKIEASEKIKRIYLFIFFYFWSAFRSSILIYVIINNRSTHTRSNNQKKKTHFYRIQASKYSSMDFSQQF